MLTPYFITNLLIMIKYGFMVKKQTFVCDSLKPVGDEFGFKCRDFLVRNAF